MNRAQARRAAPNILGLITALTALDAYMLMTNDQRDALTVEVDFETYVRISRELRRNYDDNAPLLFADEPEPPIPLELKVAGCTIKPARKSRTCDFATPNSGSHVPHVFSPSIAK